MIGAKTTQANDIVVSHETEILVEEIEEFLATVPETAGGNTEELALVA